jgi:hypothetical protein
VQNICQLEAALHRKLQQLSQQVSPNSHPAVGYMKQRPALI